MKNELMKSYEELDNRREEMEYLYELIVDAKLGKKVALDTMKEKDDILGIPTNKENLTLIEDTVVAELNKVKVETRALRNPIKEVEVHEF